MHRLAEKTSAPTVSSSGEGQTPLPNTLLALCRTSNLKPKCLSLDDVNLTVIVSPSTTCSAVCGGGMAPARNRADLPLKQTGGDRWSSCKYFPISSWRFSGADGPTNAGSVCCGGVCGTSVCCLCGGKAAESTGECTQRSVQWKSDNRGIGDLGGGTHLALLVCGHAV